MKWQKNITKVCILVITTFAIVFGSLLFSGEFEGIGPKDLASLPSHFDWRDNGGNWMTPVKFQGYQCGSCSALAAVGAVEAQFNIASGDPSLDLDLSEQYLVSDCCTSCGDCMGGWSKNTLTFIRDEGITDEACFPYTARNSPCLDRCADWDNRLYYIDETGYVPSDVETIKEYLIEKGPLVAHLCFGGSCESYWDNGIYRCGNDSGGDGHAVVLVGYNETQNYWIVRNSLGADWNGDGYFNVGCGECSIESSVNYAIIYHNAPTPTPSITHIDSSPFLFVYQGATCNLPDALTNIGPDGLNLVITVWGTLDIDGDGVKEWVSYYAELGAGNLRELVNGKPYIMTHEGGICNNWEIVAN